MATITIKQVKCANCGHVQNSEFVENITKDLTFSNYNLFKTYSVQVCQNCGYASSNLEIEREKYSKVCNLKDSNFDFRIDLLNNLKIYNSLIENEDNISNKLRILASIFNAKKILLNSFLKENYNKKNAEADKLIRSLQKDFLDYATKTLLVIKENENINYEDFNNDFVKILKAELLCVISETKLAKEIINSLNLTDEKLVEYLECCVEIGGNLCFNS